MKAGKNKVLRAVLGILVLFVLINAGWLIWRTVKYGSYIRGMEKNVFATWIVPRYQYTDAEGYDYGVKYPEYLSLTGNMSVGLPTTEDNWFTDFIIIWPKLFGGYEYGVSISEGNQDYQIYINADGSAVNPEDSKLVADNQETIQELLTRAQQMWELEK